MYADNMYKYDVFGLFGVLAGTRHHRGRHEGDIEGDIGSNSGSSFTASSGATGAGRGGGGDRRGMLQARMYNAMLTVCSVFHFSLSNNRREIKEAPDPPTWQRRRRYGSLVDTPTPLDRPPSAQGRPPRINHRAKGPLGRTDVYVDDFILLAQGGKRRRRCR